jgi:hypothetical protein
MSAPHVVNPSAVKQQHRHRRSLLRRFLSASATSFITITPIVAATIAVAILAVGGVTGCATQSEDEPTVAEVRGPASVLAGEWEVPSDQSDYLLFKPEPDDPKAGRFGGVADYDRYQIKGRLSFGRRITVDLQSATADTDAPTASLTIDFARDGKSLTTTKPGARSGQRYVKVQQ